MGKLIEAYDIGLDGRMSPKHLCFISIPEECIKETDYGVQVTGDAVRLVNNRLKGKTIGWLCLRYAQVEKDFIKKLRREIEKLQIELNDLLKHQH